MGEYILRSETLKHKRLMEAFDWNGNFGNFRDTAVLVKDILKIPSADVEPVRHGRWEPVLEGVWNLPTPVLVGWRCSQCGRTEQEKEPYCNCGAKMDGECDA